MADLAILKIRVPKFRIRVARLVIWVLARVIKNEKTVGRAVDILLDWALRGMKVTIQ